MKKTILCFLIGMFTLAFFHTPVFAESNKTETNPPREEMIDSYTDYLSNGFLVVHSVNLSSRGYYSKTATHTANFYASGTLIATISLQATFHYDGNSVSVTSKSVTLSDTYNGWSYSQDSFSSSGGTVTLNGTLSKIFHINQTFSMSLTCDKDGNISAI